MFVYIHPTFLKIPMFDEPIFQPPLIWYIPYIISMYGIFTYIWLIFMVNVGIYIYHTWILWDIYIYNESILPGYFEIPAARWLVGSTLQPVISGVVVWSCTGSRWFVGFFGSSGTVVETQRIWTFAPWPGEMIRWVKPQPPTRKVSEFFFP